MAVGLYCKWETIKTYLRCFAGNETENNDFVVGKVLKRLKCSRTVAIVLELRSSERSDVGLLSSSAAT